MDINERKRKQVQKMDIWVSDGYEYENYGLLGYIVTCNDVSEKRAGSISSHEGSSERPAFINNIT
jgi:hypothetical protein